MNETIRKGLRYLLVGGGTALLELVLFQLFLFLLMGNVAVANVAAVVVSTICNFALNRSFTFESAANPRKSFIRYCMLFAANLTFSTLTIRWLMSLGVPSAVAKLATQCCTTCWNFVLYKKFVFPTTTETGEE